VLFFLVNEEITEFLQISCASVILYEKDDSENEHWNNHFAMYCAIIVLKYYF
jgi:hypothetical protein